VVPAGKMCFYKYIIHGSAPLGFMVNCVGRSDHAAGSQANRKGVIRCRVYCTLTGRSLDTVIVLSEGFRTPSTEADATIITISITYKN